MLKNPNKKLFPSQFGFNGHPHDFDMTNPTVKDKGSVFISNSNKKIIA